MHRRIRRAPKETLSAIHNGAADSLIVTAPSGMKKTDTLKSADHAYRVLVESMNEGALMLNGEGMILYCNARMAAIVDRPLESVMGGKLSEFLVGSDASALEKVLRGATASRKMTVKLRATAATVLVSLTPLDLEGKRSFSVIITDLTEAFALRQSVLQKDASLRLVARSAPAVLFTVGSNGRVLSASGAALKSIRGRVKAMLDAPVAGTSPASALSMRLQAVRVGKASYTTLYLDRLWKVKLERLGIDGVIGIAVDVTAELRAREKDENASREHRQRDFVANVSHEFRTPLTAIQGYAETLLGGAIDDKTLARDFVQTIARQTTRLSNLVEKILYMRSVENGALKPQGRTIDAVCFAEGMLEDLRLLASRRQVHFKLAIPKNTRVFADEEQLRRVFMCVAGNAIVYSHPDGKVVISAKTAGAQVTLSVTDAGIGIKAAELPFIFDRFHRAKNARLLAIKGTGLGLSIAKTLIENNNGRIWAERAPGKGTCFNISLPAAQN